MVDKKGVLWLRPQREEVGSWEGAPYPRAGKAVLKTPRGARGDGAGALGEGLSRPRALRGLGWTAQACLGSGYAGPEVAAWKATPRGPLPGREGSSEIQQPSRAQGLVRAALLFAGERVTGRNAEAAQLRVRRTRPSGVCGHAQARISPAGAHVHAFPATPTALPS